MNSKIELDVDTKSMGSESLVRVEFEFSSLERGVVHSRLARSLWIQNRPFTKPKVVALLRDADGWLGEFKLCVNAMVGRQQETVANDAVLSDESGKILPLRTQFEINAAEGQDWTVGVDCKIRIDDPKQLLNRGNVVTATFTIRGKIVHVKCIATR